MAFNVMAQRNLSAYSEALHRKVVLLRRMSVKHPSARNDVATIYRALKHCQFNGTVCEHDVLSSCSICPPPVQGARETWQPAGTPVLGPVSMLLQSLFEVAAGLDDHLVIHGDATLKIDVMNCPYQHLKPSLMLLSNAARTKFLSTVREDYASMHSFDHMVYHKAFNKLSTEDKAWITNVHVMAAWTPDKLAHTFDHLDAGCPYCSHHEGTIIHWYYQCPKFLAIRQAWHQHLQLLDPGLEAHAILIGLPPKLPSDLNDKLFNSNATNAIPARASHLTSLLRTKRERSTIPRLPTSLV